MSASEHECLHEKDLGFFESEINNLKDCSERVKKRQDGVDKVLRNIEINYLTKEDLDKFQKSIIFTMVVGFFLFLATQIGISIVGKSGLV